MAGKKVFELGRYYSISPYIIECNLNQDYVFGELKYNYTVTTDEGTVERCGFKTVELDCSKVVKKEIRHIDTYVTLSDGEDEVTSAMTISYSCIPTNREVTHCVDQDSIKVLYESKDKKRWVEDGIVPKEGGMILVSFKFTEYVKDASGETSSEDIYNDIIEIAPCDCNEDSECGGTLTGEIEYKLPHSEGCNIVRYTVEQERCNKDDK